MTTIAYDLNRREVATDGRVTESDSGDIATDEGVKMYSRAGLMVFMAGDLADVDETVNAFIACSHRVRKTMDVHGLIWTGTKLFEIVSSFGLLDWHQVVAATGAIGSGAPYAIAALDSGATPRAAVAAAAKRNCFTGGKIRVYKL